MDAARVPERQAVLTPLTQAALFLVVVVSPGTEDMLRQVLDGVNGLKRSVGLRIPEGVLTCVTGIGSSLWDRLFARARPAEFHPFPGFEGARPA